MTMMTLYSGPLSMFGAKVHIAALEKGLSIQVIMVPYTRERGYDPKHPEVARINPKSQVPVLIHDNVEIFDSTQIFEYFEHLNPRPPLWPAAPAARAHARLLELKSDEVFFPYVIRLMGLQDHLGEPDAQQAIAQANRYYVEADALLERSDYLAGDYSYADIAFYMAQLFAARLGAPMTTATPRLLAWRDGLTARPAVRRLVLQFADTLTGFGLLLPDFIERAVRATAH